MTPDDLLRQADTEIERAERLLDVATVARAFHVSAQTVRNWIKAGKLIAEKTPTGRSRVRYSAFVALKEMQKSQSPHV